MNGQLLTIIFNFFYQIFAQGSWSGADIQKSIYFFLFPSSLTSYGYDNFYQFMIDEIGLGSDEYFAYVFATISSFIIIIVLIVLLFKLFKWIFRLIFKLFRLN